MKRNILIVEDNPDIGHLVEIHLRDLPADIDRVADGAEGLQRAQTRRYDLIILDLMLPTLDGLEVCRCLRQGSDYTPILMVTAKTTELDRVLGLELGADDYMTKPFSIHELVARVKAILRRIDAMASKPVKTVPQSINFNGLVIEPEKRHVTIDGHPVELTAREFDLLLHFAQHPGRVYSRPQLLDQVWGYGHDGYEHTVNSHVNRLRAKIEKDPAKPDFVITVWGVGYKFADAPVAENC
jgi:DNA-binding response OmpR family regulator